jgi:hypothetical protein
MSIGAPQEPIRRTFASHSKDGAHIFSCLCGLFLVCRESSSSQSLYQDVSRCAAAPSCERSIFIKGKEVMLPIAKRTLFYGIKLPFILVLIILGFMMEYIVELPFNVLTRLDGRRRCKGN